MFNTYYRFVELHPRINAAISIALIASTVIFSVAAKNVINKANLK